MLATMYRHAKVWLAGALAASPAEMIGLLQDYLDVETSTELRSTSGMGQGVALELARQMPVSAREGECAIQVSSHDLILTDGCALTLFAR